MDYGDKLPPSPWYIFTPPRRYIFAPPLTDYDWCTEMTVGYGMIFPNHYYGFTPNWIEGGHWGRLSNRDIAYEDKIFRFQRIGFTADVYGGRLVYVYFTKNEQLPDGMVLNLGGARFVADGNSWFDDVSTGKHIFVYPNGFSMVEGQKMTLSAKFPDDTNTTGQPSITGTPQVGETLTANTGDIMDSDGLGAFSYQWIRVDGLTETTIAGATSNTYAPITADVGKRIKVKVSFTDGDGTEESVTGDAYPSRGYPSSAIGIAAAKTACPADNDWCAELTVGYGEHGDPVVEFYYGFTPLNVYRSDGGGGFTGTLSNRELSYNSTNVTFQRLGITDKEFTFVYAGFANSERVPDGTVFNYGGTTFTADSENFSYDTFGIGQYVFNHRSGLSMVEGQKMTVSVTFPESTNSATGQPSITGTPQVGQTLSVSTADIVDADGKTKAENDDVGYAYTYQWLRLDEGTETEISDATADSYTLSDDDEGATVKVRVSFTDDRDNPEGPLESAATATVTAPAVAGLTAEFLDVPDEHDSSSAFTFRLAFSEDIRNGYRRVRDDLLSTTGGTVTGARRVEKRRDLWEIEVEPSGSDAVTVTLAAGEDCATAPCTNDRRTLSEEISATIAGPSLPGLSIADAEVEEGPGAKLAFAITLDRAASGTVTVQASTSDGTAVAGEDYRAKTLTKTFAPGETRKIAVIRVLEDGHDDDGETMTLTLSNPTGAYIADGTATGTITNSDPLQKMWLSRFGRTVALQTIQALEGRFAIGSDASPRMTMTVAGQSMDLSRIGDDEALAETMTGLARAFGAPGAPAANPGSGSGAGSGDDPFARHGIGGSWNEADSPAPAQPVTGRDLLLGSSFHFTTGEASGLGGAMTGWGKVLSGGSSSSFGGGLSFTSETATGVLGMDWERDRLLVGVALSRSVEKGSAAFDRTGLQYDIEGSLSMVTPYLHVQAGERLSFWSAVGSGSGSMSLSQGGGWQTADIAVQLAAAGGRAELLRPGADGGLALALKTDAFFVRSESARVSTPGVGNLTAATGDASRVRAVLEGSRAFALAGGGALAPSLSLGLRHDGGDAETGSGVEVGAGLTWSAPAAGLTSDLRLYGLAAHEAGGYDEWGASGSLRMVPGASGRGMSLSMTPSWGARDQAGRLWDAAPGGLAGDGDREQPGMRLDTELGYGLPLSDGLTGTPYAGFGFGEAGARDYRLGWRLASDRLQSFSLGVEATRREAANDNGSGEGGKPEHGMTLRAGLRW